MSDKTEPLRVLVSCNIFDPSGFTIFKHPANTRAECTTISCSLESCPLRDAGACMLIGVFGGTRCPYGNLSRERGYTKRAGKYHQWINARKEQYADVGCLEFPKTKMAIVGDYVYLPYAHMAMVKAVPFLCHSGFLSSGTCLVPKSDWTLAAVLVLLDARPQAMMGGTISAYQKKSVPLFLLHLRETDPKMWAELATERPALDIAPDHVGRKAILKTLKAPFEWTTRHDKYPVKWEWDGIRAKTHSPHAYSKTWGDLKAEGLTVAVVPPDDADIVVQDNTWVTTETVFTT